jgi:hypothetical protein
LERNFNYLPNRECLKLLRGNQAEGVGLAEQLGGGSDAR